MSSHTLRSVVLMVMLACSQALALYAKNTAKVGASNGVPALAVFAAARTGCPAMRPDTVKSPDELAREHSTDADADFDRMAAELRRTPTQWSCPWTRPDCNTLPIR